MSSLSESGSTCRPKKNGSNDCRLCGNGGFNGGSSARFFAFSASRSRRFIFGSSAIATCSRRCRGRRPGATAASPRLLAKIASGQPLPVGRDLVVGMIHDFCRMCRLLGEEAQVQRRFHSVEALVKAHDALAARVLAKGCASDMQYEFPAPPVSDWHRCRSDSSCSMRFIESGGRGNRCRRASPTPNAALATVGCGLRCKATPPRSPRVLF